MKKIFVLSVFALILLSALVLANADISDDGIIDVSDLILVAADFGKNSGFNNPKSDTNTDGVVDIFDVVYVASRFT